ncbi:unnamed protein product [Brassica oleracea]
MGISNEQYPTKDGAANIHYDEDDLVRVDAELTIGILRKLVYMNDFFRLNYKSDSTLLLTKSTKEFDIQEIIGPIVYKIWDNGISKSLQYHQTMCRLLIQSQLQDKISEKHKCPICTDKSEEAQEEKAQEDSSDDPIKEDEATPTKAINISLNPRKSNNRRKSTIFKKFIQLPPATPHAKKLAKQHKVDIGSVAGTGPFGRITASDVEAAAGIAPTVTPPPPPPSPAAAPAPTAKATTTSSPPLLPDASIVPFTAVQSAVSKNMIESLSVPTFRVGYPVNTDALDALYEKVKPKGVTMTALLAKAAGMALAQHPVVNASCKDGKSFSYNSNINVAVAVAINGGLITPVLQDADKLDLYLLSQKWKELVGKARSKQLQPHEYNSGTFTLSNLGMFGVDRFDAILLPGQGAIMAVGASKPTVVADKDGFFSVKNKMLVNVTADHRIVYGADLAAFLQTFAKIVENPDSLTL